MASCYEEMTEEDVQGGRLVFDESPTGCGKGTYGLLIPLSSASS